MNRIYKPVLFLMLTLVLFSCRKDEIKYEEDIVIITSTEEGEVGLQGHITDSSKNSVSGAQITVGDRIVITDEYGYFIFDDAKVINGNVTLTIEKDDFLTQYKKVPVMDEMEDAFVRASLLSSQNTIHTFPSDQPTTITGNGGHTVTFLPNSIVNENGEVYDGEVIFSSYYIDPTRSDLADIIPGDLSAINLRGEEVQLVSFGMFFGELTTPAGAPLKIKEGSTATIELAIQASQLGATADQIPLWSLDKLTKTWLEEGIALKEGNTYVAKISHFSFLNCGASFPVVDVIGFAIDQNGLPISNATIFVTVSGVGDTRFCTTDRNGRFFGKFPKDSDLLIGVYDCVEESILPFGPFSESTTTGEINFNVSEFGFVLEGDLRDCDVLPVHPGFVEITQNNGEKTLIPSAEDGSFVSSFFGCSSSSIIFKGIDPIAHATSEDVTLELEEGINGLGDINVCDFEQLEFLTLTINGQQQVFSNPTADRIGDILTIYAVNGEFSLRMRLQESDLSNPIKSITIFLSDGSGTPVFVWFDEEVNDFITLSYTAEGGAGEMSSGMLSGDYEGIVLECEYGIIVENELTIISGVIWDDINQNGIRETGEPPIEGVQLRFDTDYSMISTGIVSSKATDEFGRYFFTGNHLSNNTITIELPTGYVLSEANVGSDSSIDSDFNPITKEVEVTINGPGEAKYNIDAGIHN